MLRKARQQLTAKLKHSKPPKGRHIPVELASILPSLAVCHADNSSTCAGAVVQAPNDEAPVKRTVSLDEESEACARLEVRSSLQLRLLRHLTQDQQHMQISVSRNHQHPKSGCRS